MSLAIHRTSTVKTRTHNSIWRREKGVENRNISGILYEIAMADVNIDVSNLPLEIRAKLAELDLELSEGKRLFTVLLQPLKTGFSWSRKNREKCIAEADNVM